MTSPGAFLPGELLQAPREPMFWAGLDLVDDPSTFVSSGSILLFVGTSDDFSLVLAAGCLGFVRSKWLMRLP